MLIVLPLTHDFWISDGPTSPPSCRRRSRIEQLFRLIVGRVEETPAGSQIYQVDALREPVRLGGGLSKDKMLDCASQVRG